MGTYRDSLAGSVVQIKPEILGTLRREFLDNAGVVHAHVGLVRLRVGGSDSDANEEPAESVALAFGEAT